MGAAGEAHWQAGRAGGTVAGGPAQTQGVPSEGRVGRRPRENHVNSAPGGRANGRRPWLCFFPISDTAEDDMLPIVHAALISS